MLYNTFSSKVVVLNQCSTSFDLHDLNINQYSFEGMFNINVTLLFERRGLIAKTRIRTTYCNIDRQIERPTQIEKNPYNEA